MHLKSLTLKGFKSFPDRTVLEFRPGVSVIVGPNGSGKSNVTDAVLWALGEQSPVAVRGQSMQDVIFGGAPGRQSAPRAEVELVLDDSEGLLGLGPEVSIVRRLDRAGEGEYRLSGARCRLVDVIEVLSDTGLGKEMHSVISQGRVESIVTSKPRDRRALVEEAAGLGKHRKRRRRTQLKLERTEHNLDRALDVEREARARLRPLKRQAEAAELHARLERQTLEARWELVRDEVRERSEGVAAHESRVGELRSGRQRIEGELEEVSNSRESAERALTARAARREELSRRCFSARGAGERVGERAEALGGAAEATEARIGRARERLVRLRTAEATGPDDGAVHERIAALEAAVEEATREREAEIAREVEELERQRAEAQLGLSERQAEVAVALGARQAAEGRSESAHGAVGETARVVERARLQAARVGAELHSVNQLIRGHEAAARGVSTLADEVDVEEGYELALAAALDGRLAAALAPDRHAAQRLLDSTAAADGGRVLVADEILRDSLPGAPPAPGAVPMAEHVRGDGEAAAVVRALLHDAWIVENLEGLSAAFEGVAVTRTGRAWSPRAGELRQAPAAGDEQLLAHRNRRDQLLSETERAAADEIQARTAHERAIEELSQCESAREQALSAHRAAVRARDEATEEEHRLAQLINRRQREAGDDVGARHSQLQAELAAQRLIRDRAAQERARRSAAVTELERILGDEEQRLPVMREAVSALSAAAEAIALQGERFERELAEDRQAADQIAADLRTCAQREATLQAELHRLGEALTDAEVAAQRARDQMQEALAQLGELATRLELAPEPRVEPLADEEREALNSRLERLARRRSQLGPVNPLAADEYAEAVAHVEELERQREDLETALRELEKLIRDTDRQIEECFERTFAATARNFDELVGRLFPGGTGRLRLVAERAGPSAALGGQQVADGDGDGAAPGGQDSEGEEPEALGIEIEIMPAGKRMQRLSLLSGGEKSLTALAFLFAVFLARPCPFYILDEVEAALDDLNIDRFLDLLRSYADRAQFIVVTHQKRTMEAADSLYGVVMGADGISKVVSRRLPAAAAA
ncbi:MAG TPA: AAA family ATPase [Solirubrobacteraceae bacterium]|nr:AAA family ATPase [Solirubrobacteraceae bacterium]